MTVIAASSLRPGDMIFEGVSSDLNNLILHPTFASDPLGTVVAGPPSVAVQADVTGRTQALRVTAPIQSGHGSYTYDYVTSLSPVTAGNIYSFGVYGYIYSGTLSGSFTWYDSTSTALGTVDTDVELSTGSYVLKAENATAPSGAVAVSCQVNNSATYSAGFDFEILGLTFNDEAFVNALNDGDSQGWEWTGTPGASTSQTVNQVGSRVALVQAAVHPEPAGYVRVGIEREPWGTYAVFVSPSSTFHVLNR